MSRPRIIPAIGVLFLSFLLLFLLAACSEKLSMQTGLTAQDLYSMGQQHQAAKQHGKAIEAYKSLLERFPNSPLAGKSQLALANTQMDNKDDLEAEVAFDDFLRLYPADDNVPYALFRKGELLARQVPDPGRDQTKTLEAIKALTMSREKSPGGPFAGKAAARIAELRDRLAEHENRVVSHYLGRKQYVSAEVRARRALSEYPEAAPARSIMSSLAIALEKQEKKGEAAEVRRILAEKYPPPKGKKP